MRKDGESEINAVLPRFHFYLGCFAPDIGHLTPSQGGPGCFHYLNYGRDTVKITAS
jgi:hypothetical protein